MYLYAYLNMGNVITAESAYRHPHCINPGHLQK
jgi:hypothetical protein